MKTTKIAVANLSCMVVASDAVPCKGVAVVTVHCEGVASVAALCAFVVASVSVILISFAVGMYVILWLLVVESAYGTMTQMAGR